MDIRTPISNYLDSLDATINNLDRGEVAQLITLIFKTYKNNKQIFVMGNGGSSSTASHFVCDLNKGVSYGKDKKIRAIGLTDNVPSCTAYSNDVSYDDIFSEQLKNFLNPGDLVIAISGSGNSKNILKAVEYANSKKITTVGLTGYDGGKLKKIAKFSANTNINDMEISEDLHLSLCHIVKRTMLANLNNDGSIIQKSKLSRKQRS